MKKTRSITVLKGALGTFAALTLSFGYGQSEADMIKFSALCYTDSRMITWVTAFESETDYFTLEKSEDLENWSFVENVPAAGASNENTDYTVMDYSQSTTGYTYYRLILTGMGGDETIFTDEEAKCEQGEDNTFGASPNPVGGGKITVVTPVTGTINDYTLTDRSGQTIKKGIFFGKDSTIDMSDCGSGMYFLYINNEPKPIRIIRQ